MVIFQRNSCIGWTCKNPKIYPSYCFWGFFSQNDNLDHFIFEINVGRGRIRHKTTLNLNLQTIFSLSRNSSFNFRVVLCRIRLFATLISKINGLGIDFPLMKILKFPGIYPNLIKIILSTPRWPNPDRWYWTGKISGSRKKRMKSFKILKVWKKADDQFTFIFYYFLDISFILRSEESGLFGPRTSRFPPIYKFIKEWAWTKHLYLLGSKNRRKSIDVNLREQN